MKKILLIAFSLAAIAGYAQDCFYGVQSENTANGENISTGGAFEYAAASDFDIPFGVKFTASQLKFNVLKGEADLNYVNVSILEDFQGKPGDAIHTFENLVPVSQEFVYATDIEDMDAYEITVEFPTSFDLSMGKYYIQLQGAPGDDVAVSWEISNQETTTLGRFDFFKFDTDPWFGGFSYYDHTFEISGTCTDTGEEQPDYGEACSQGNESNEYETGIGFNGILADDFVVEENTKFYLSSFKISTLQLGNIVNANIKIRKSEDGTPGEVVYSTESKGPKTENFYGYHPFEGFPLDVVAVDLEFELDEAVELTAGEYFLEIQATAFPFTDFLAWEATTVPGIGGYAFYSMDMGETWNEADGLNLVFEVYGFCKESLGVNDAQNTDFSFYPNPVKDELNILSKTEIKNVSVYNVSGQSVLNSRSNSKNISTSSLTSGVYMVRVELANGQIETFKIVKK